MSLPTWLARVNRRYVNPGAIRRGTWPVLVHVGRKSGRTYRTPLDANQVDDGYVFTVNYGSRSDWPKNVMAAGEAHLELDGEIIGLIDPRMVPADIAYELLPPDAKTPPSFVGVEQCLMMTKSQIEVAS